MHVHDLTAEAETRVPRQRGLRTTRFPKILATRASRRTFRSARYDQTNGSSSFHREANQLLETFAAQAVIAIENVRLFKEFRSATQNCARPWSIRRQLPRCSALSAARPLTYSRCSTPSSRAPRGFVGSMMWCCDSARGTLWFCGLILVPYPLRRVEISMDEPRSLDARAWHAPHSRRPRAERFPRFGFLGGCVRFLAVPLRQQGELIGTLTHGASRCVPSLRRRSSSLRPSPTRP